MADLQVTHTEKDRYGNITALCGRWGRVSASQAIREIEDRTNSYYVEEFLPRVAVIVASGASGKYLRTEADRSSRNNLDNLPTR